jgi:arginine:pyruvate transaminase
MHERPIDPSTNMPLSSMLDALAVDGMDGWSVHYRALTDRAAGGDVIVLSVGDPDFATPPAITDAAIEALHDEQTHYTLAGGITPLVDAIAGHETERLGWTVEPDRVVVCAGAQNALYCTMRALVDQGDEVILLSPPYTMFEGVVRAAGGTARLVPLQRADGFQVDLDALEKTITPRTRAILLNSPHNPSGAIANAQVLDAIAAHCIDKGIWLISDEVYADLCFESEFTSPSILEGMQDRTIILRSLSKTHAMTGWRVGWMVAPQPICQGARDLLNHAIYGSPGFVQHGALAAFTRDIPEAVQMKQAYQERRDLLVDALSKVNSLDCMSPESGIFCIVGIDRLGMPAQEFAERLYDAERVAVLPGEAFGSAHSDWVRLSLCQPADMLQEAVVRMTRFIGTL